MAAPDQFHQDIWSAFDAGRVWQGASPETLSSLVDASTLHSFERGSYVAFENDAADKIGLVVGGRIRGAHLPPGGRPITVWTFRPGDIFGLMALTHRGHYLVDFDALEDSMVAFIPAEQLIEGLRSDPRLLTTLLEEFGRQFALLASVIKMLSLDVPGRVAAHLVLSMDNEPTSPGMQQTIDLGMSRVELAAALGTVPETLSRAFRQLQEQGIIASDGRQRVVILDSQRLVSRANLSNPS